MNAKAAIVPLMLLAVTEAVIICILGTVNSRLEDQRDNAEAALEAAIVVINTSSDNICPGWLFDSNLADAKSRICKGH